MMNRKIPAPVWQRIDEMSMAKWHEMLCRDLIAAQNRMVAPDGMAVQNLSACRRLARTRRAVTA
jgi:hypothetical protein